MAWRSVSPNRRRWPSASAPTAARAPRGAAREGSGHRGERRTDKPAGGGARRVEVGRQTVGVGLFQGRAKARPRAPKPQERRRQRGSHGTSLGHATRRQAGQQDQGSEPRLALKAKRPPRWRRSARRASRCSHRGGPGPFWSLRCRPKRHSMALSSCRASPSGCPPACRAAREGHVTCLV